MLKVKLAVALLGVAALALPVQAQYEKQQGTQQGQQGTQMSGQRQRAQGEITDVRTVKDKQTGQDHLMAKIKMDNGQTVMADLGPEAEAKDSGLDFKKGQQIQVEGMVGQMDDKPVLVVTRAEQGGKTVNLNTQRSKGQRYGTQPGEKSTQEKSGQQKGTQE